MAELLELLFARCCHLGIYRPTLGIRLSADTHHEGGYEAEYCYFHIFPLRRSVIGDSYAGTSRAEGWAFTTLVGEAEAKAAAKPLGNGADYMQQHSATFVAAITATLCEASEPHGTKVRLCRVRPIPTFALALGESEALSPPYNAGEEP